jgi:DNA-directed RNA polymerase subunit RPC12/RpoP
MSTKDSLQNRICARLSGNRWTALLQLLVLGFVIGCGGEASNSVLDSGVNGYHCLNCKGKFYAETKAYVVHCPSCKQTNIEQVIGYQCGSDQQVTIGSSKRSSIPCKQCGAVIAGRLMPSAAQLEEWGATRKTAAEVGGS